MSLLILIIILIRDLHIREPPLSTTNSSNIAVLLSHFLNLEAKLSHLRKALVKVINELLSPLSTLIKLLTDSRRPTLIHDPQQNAFHSGTPFLTSRIYRAIRIKLSTLLIRHTIHLRAHDSIQILTLFVSLHHILIPRNIG